MGIADYILIGIILLLIVAAIRAVLSSRGNRSGGFCSGCRFHEECKTADARSKHICPETLSEKCNRHS